MYIDAMQDVYSIHQGDGGHARGANLIQVPLDKLCKPPPPRRARAGCGRRERRHDRSGHSRRSTPRPPRRSRAPTTRAGRIATVVEEPHHEQDLSRHRRPHRRRARGFVVGFVVDQRQVAVIKTFRRDPSRSFTEPGLNFNGRWCRRVDARQAHPDAGQPSADAIFHCREKTS